MFFKHKERGESGESGKDHREAKLSREKERLH